MTSWIIKKLRSVILRKKDETPEVKKPPLPPAPEPAARPSKKKHTRWNVSQFEVPPAEGRTRFHDLNLPSKIMHAIADLGFKYCTPVQAEILPQALTGKDATGQARNQ